MTTPEKIPGNQRPEHSLDAGAWLSSLDHAPTKAEHDARVEATGRPYTDPGRGRAHRSMTQEAHPNGARPSGSPL